MIPLLLGLSIAQATPAAAPPDLDFWVGTWTVKQGGQIVGTDIVEKALNGFAVFEHWKDADGNEGKSLFYYMPAKKQWKQVWVTPIGAFLRRTSLDELPQLFNVLEGTMSLVGPRPHANAHNEQFRKQIQGYMLRHKVKPGITGLAQVSGWRGETDTLDKMLKRVECDHQYIREWSPWLDLKILFKTIAVVFARRNAH